MKSSFSALMAVAVVAACGCSTTASKNAAPAPTPPASNSKAKSGPSPEEVLGLKRPGDVAGEDTRAKNPKPYVDPETGKKVIRIEKVVGGQYYEKDGLLHLAIVAGPGVPILRQDATSWIVEAPPERKKPEPKATTDSDAEEGAPIIELPASETLAVTPKTSRDPLRFEEISAGLPRSGMWRENFDLGDVLGVGHPQIVAPPARLTGKFLRVFRLDKDDAGAWRWRDVELKVDNPDKIEAAYGAATVADIDGDGKLDIVFGGHGSGPAIALNEGAGKFRVESRGLPRQMSTRAIAVGDLNGDGRVDILAISDDLEWANVRGRPTLDPGHDVPARLRRSGVPKRGLDLPRGPRRSRGRLLRLRSRPRRPARERRGASFLCVGLPVRRSATISSSSIPSSEAFALRGHRRPGTLLPAHGIGGRHLPRPARGLRCLVQAFALRRPPKIDGQGVTVYYRARDGKMASKRVVKTLGSNPRRTRSPSGT